MPELTSIAREDLERLQARARRLAMEKSYLHLVFNLINKLSGVPGLDDTVENLVRLVLDNVGGSNVALYYPVDGKWHYVDAYGKKKQFDGLDDDLARQAASTRALVERLHDFGDTKMLTAEFTKASTWATPLVVGDEVFGVLKIEDMMLSAREAREHMQTFFNYAALVLKNEIQGYSKLKKAYDELASEVAERKRVEAEVRELNTELQTALREMEEISYTMAHDLRSPARAIDGFAARLAEVCGPALSDEGHRLLETVRAGARRMGRLVDDLLTFSRISRRSLRMRPIDMNALVAEVVAALRLAPEGLRAEVRVAHLPAVVADAEGLGMVWENLITNATKFCSGRADPLIEIGCRTGADGPEFFVKDNGVGFDPNYAEQIFGLFNRLHRSDQFDGTGIGLALVKRIVQRHSGRVWAESAVGPGATFSFTLGHS